MQSISLCNLFQNFLFGKGNHQLELDTVNERAKLGLLCILLLFALLFTAFTAANTLHAMRNLQQQYSSVKAGDVSTIRPWMTIHAISHIYHVPEDYLYRSLDTRDTGSLHHATLFEIASRKRQSVNQVIHTIQHAILTYRKGHPGISTPTPPHRSSKKHFSLAPGRTKY